MHDILKGSLGKFADPLPTSPNWSDHQIVAPPRPHTPSMGVEQAERKPHVCYVAQPGDESDDMTRAIKREVIARIKRCSDETPHPRGPISEAWLELEPFDVVIDVTNACSSVQNIDRDYASLDSTGSEEVTFSAKYVGTESRDGRHFATYHVQQAV